MGVDHMGTSPPEFGVGTLMQIVALRFCHIDTKKKRSVAFKIRQNPSVFDRASAPNPVGGAHDAPQTS